MNFMRRTDHQCDCYQQSEVFAAVVLCVQWYVQREVDILTSPQNYQSFRLL